MKKTFEEMSVDENFIRITKRASARFSKVLRSEEIQNCALLALWKAMERYDASKSNGMKFTSYLFRGIMMECLTQYKANIGHQKVPNLAHAEMLLDMRPDPRETVDVMDEISNLPYRDILYDKYIMRLTIREISKKYGVSMEAVRVKILQSKKKRQMAAC